MLRQYRQKAETLAIVWILSGCLGQHPKECNSDIGNQEIDFKTTFLQNKAAYIPSMCYTKTMDDQNHIHNPCYACHTQGVSPNFVNDGDLQTVYRFPLLAQTNHWSNLFMGREAEVALISDDQINSYINQSNYFNDAHEIILAKKLKHLPKAWDIFDNSYWYGYTPDCYFNFDAEGFDINPDEKKYSGWRAFHYTPFLGTFWPTNGSTDDVMIRLSEPFRSDKNGKFDISVYRANLSIVEALTLKKDVFLNTIDELSLGHDLDGNGVLTHTERIMFNAQGMHFVGMAGDLQDLGKLHAITGLFPVGTEFLHSVRYVDIDAAGNATLTPRMKELRYGIKRYWVEPEKLKEMADKETQERIDYPDQLKQFDGNIHIGLDNKQGWLYQGFIEDREGELRPQTYEETYFCMGCHSGIGATTDSVFAFPRKAAKIGIFQHGWAHATQNTQVDAEPKRADGRYEYTYYLEQNHAGDEFRENQEVMHTFFTENGELKPVPVAALHDNISVLISPSKKRAIEANKAYRVIVKKQRFIYGRDATSKVVRNVHRGTKENQPTGIGDIVTSQ